ncbi:radical SAM protein [Natronospora cellulosivora (SeqCode)]
MEYIKLKRLEFAITYNCSSKCEHCFIDENRKKKYPGTIKPDIAESIVRKLASNYDIESIMTFGGEPLLYPELIYQIHKTARELGIKSRQIITNAYWSKNEEKINAIAKDLLNSGVNNVFISVDVFHQKHIPLSIIKKTAESLINNGVEMIKWNPCWLVSKDEDNKYNQKTKEILKELNYLGAKVSSGNIVSPNGLALKNLLEYMPAKIKYPKGKCGDQPYTSNLDNIESICIDPNGDIAICSNLKIGNVFEANILDVLKNYNPYEVEEMRCILEKGMDGLMEYASKENITLNPDGYYSICDMCQDIISASDYCK